MKELLVGWLVLFCISCSSGNRIAYGSTSHGQPYEVLVVMDSCWWNRPAGQALFRALDTDVPGLPQSESSLNVVVLTPAQWDEAGQRMRNILVVTVSDTLRQSVQLKAARDVYASPQVVLQVQARDEASLLRLVSDKSRLIADYFVRAESERQQRQLALRHNRKVSERIKQLFGCDVWVPEELNVCKEGKDFLWVTTRSVSTDRHFVMYTYPYTGKDLFTKAGFVHKRDSVMKANIPGAREGMYMQTDSLLTDVEPVRVKDGYALEARGLWRMKGDFMGGPYVAHLRLDTVRRRVVAAEVFVYAPDKPKRNLLRQLEATLYTLTLPTATK